MRTTELKAAEKEKSDDPSSLKSLKMKEGTLYPNDQPGVSIRFILMKPILCRAWEGVVYFEAHITVSLFVDSNIGYIFHNEPVSGFAGYKFKKQVKIHDHWF
jgi:hypothetical protein